MKLSKKERDQITNHDTDGCLDHIRVEIDYKGRAILICHDCGDTIATEEKTK